MTATLGELESKHRPWRWALTFDYSPEMVAAIKDHIPSRQRKWVPDLRQWWFQQEAAAAMLVLAHLHCGEVRHVQASGDFAPALPTETVEAYRTLYLLPGAPEELIKHAYRVMCKMHHPDKGGTTTQMQRVNEAYGRLTRTLKSSSHSQK